MLLTKHNPLLGYQMKVLAAQAWVPVHDTSSTNNAITEAVKGAIACSLSYMDVRFQCSQSRARSLDALRFARVLPVATDDQFVKR
jgi:hypothetical protein